MYLTNKLFRLNIFENVIVLFILIRELIYRRRILKVHNLRNKYIINTTLLMYDLYNNCILYCYDQHVQNTLQRTAVK